MMRRPLILGLLLMPVLVAGAEATVWEPFSGFADVSAVQSKIDGEKQNTTRQEYNVAFDKALAPYFDLRLAFRYYKFDQEMELLLGGYREEIQPSGEIRWDHPVFALTGSVFQRHVLTPTQGKIITDSQTASLQSKDRRYPLMELRFDQQRTWAPDVDNDYEIRNRRWQANADYDAGQHSFSYSFSNVRSQNVISTQNAYVNRHLARWSGSGSPGEDGRLMLSGRYNFNYATTTNERPGSDTILEIAPISLGLYALDSQPDLGTLDPRPGLADGNRIDPVIPAIDIGTGNVDHNLGADLGLSERIAGMYIYVDRPSGNQVQWAMWGSDDNLTWTQIPVFAGQIFNPGLNRYELLCVPGDFRYVKAVNAGLNEIAVALVTEIEVLRELPEGTRDDRFISSAHALDGRARYRISERWDTSLDGSFQYDENVGSPDDRHRWGLGWRLMFEPSRRNTHQVRWDLGRESGRAGADNASFNNSLGYTWVTYPLETLRGTFSVNDRLSYFGGERSQNILGTAAELNATVLPALNLTAAGGLSWLDDFLADRSLDTWNVRGGVDATLTRSLDLILEHTYQETREAGVDGLRNRRFTSLGLDWRVTRTIYFRGSLRQTYQDVSRWNHELILSWNLTRKARISAQLYEIADEDRTTNLRKSLNFNLELGARSYLYLRLAELDLSGGGGTRTVSFQQGIRIGF